MSFKWMNVESEMQSIFHKSMANGNNSEVCHSGGRLSQFYDNADYSIALFVWNTLLAMATLTRKLTGWATINKISIVNWLLMAAYHWPTRSVAAFAANAFASSTWVCAIVAVRWPTHTHTPTSTRTIRWLIVHFPWSGFVRLASSLFFGLLFLLLLFSFATLCVCHRSFSAVCLFLFLVQCFSANTNYIFIIYFMENFLDFSKPNWMHSLPNNCFFNRAQASQIW